MMKHNSYNAGRIFITVLLAAALGGCGGGKAADGPPAEMDEGSLGAYKETLICHAGRSTIANPKLPEGDTYENNAYIRYLKKKLNVEIVDDFEANGEDYDRQVSLAIASGEMPDIMRVGSRDVLDELVENGLVEDLTDVYEMYASDYIKDIYDSYDGRCLDMATYDGRLMALPGTSLDSAPCITYIRQDWLDELGLKPDTDGDHCITVQELEEIARVFIEKDPGGSGKMVGLAFVPYLTADDYGSSGFTMNAVCSAFNAFPKSWLKDENGKVYYGSTSPQMKTALEQVTVWFADGILDPQFGTRTWDDITALLTNGQLGITFGPWHIPDWLLNNVRAMNGQAEFTAFALSDENGKVNVTHSNASAGFMVVRKGYSNPEVIIKMANLYFDDIVNSKNIEAEDPEVGRYIKDGVDGTARPISLEINAYTSLLDDYADIKNCVEGTITEAEVRTAESRNVVQSVTAYLADPLDAEVADWARYTSRMHGIELIDSLTKNEVFRWETPAFWGITETRRTNGATLGALEEEAFVAIVTGAAPIDAFDEFVNSWKKQGGETITAEIQAVLDGEGN